MYVIFNVFTNPLLHETGINLDAMAEKNSGDMFNNDKLCSCYYLCCCSRCYLINSEWIPIFHAACWILKQV